MPLIENSPSQISEANEPPGFDTTSLKNNLTLPPASFYIFFVITAALLGAFPCATRRALSPSFFLSFTCIRASVGIAATSIYFQLLTETKWKENVSPPLSPALRSRFSSSTVLWCTISIEREIEKKKTRAFFVSIF